MFTADIHKKKTYQISNFHPVMGHSYLIYSKSETLLYNECQMYFYV